MAKYDNLPHLINQVKNEIGLKENDLARAKETLATLESKLPKKAKKAEKVVKEEKDGEK